MVVEHQRPGEEPHSNADAAQPTRADALRRIAAEVSGRQDLSGLFSDVIDEAFALFGVDQAGLWTYDASAMPLQIVAQRGLSAEILELVDKLPRDARTLGMDAMRDREVRVMGGDLGPTLPALREIYLRAGIRTICYVPIVFRDEPLGLLVLYHRRDYAWTADEMELARAFADHMATAISNARLAESTRTLAGRLRAISELAGRLNRLQDVDGIAQAIVAEAELLSDHDTIRVYRVDHETRMCEPIAFKGTFLGVTDPDLSLLRVPIGQGLTGWVAENGETVRLGLRRWAGLPVRPAAPSRRGRPPALTGPDERLDARRGDARDEAQTPPEGGSNPFQPDADPGRGRGRAAGGPLRLG